MKFLSTNHPFSTESPLDTNQVDKQFPNKLLHVTTPFANALFRCQGQSEEEDVIHTVGFEARQKRF